MRSPCPELKAPLALEVLTCTCLAVPALLTEMQHFMRVPASTRMSQAACRMAITRGLQARTAVSCWKACSRGMARQ